MQSNSANDNLTQPAGKIGDEWKSHAISRLVLSTDDMLLGYQAILNDTDEQCLFQLSAA